MSSDATRVEQHVNEQSIAEDEENILTESEKAELADAVLPDYLLPKQKASTTTREQEILFANDNEARVANENDEVKVPSEEASPPVETGRRKRYFGYITVTFLVCAIIGLGIFAAIVFTQRDAELSASSDPAENATQVLPSAPMPTSAPAIAFDNTSPTKSIMLTNTNAPSGSPNALPASPSPTAGPTMLLPTAVTAPSSTMVTTVPSSTQQPPTSYACSNRPNQRVFVNDDFGNQNCEWLAEHPGHAARLCRNDAGGRARAICRQLCGTCNL
ncbi:hypothetical protein MPSEU_000190900 [Mayamaea pseudoterrestris]|nr:hypothetical protein MPSEU_000190900 [Mayamaea pseudoterrestris]